MQQAACVRQQAVLVQPYDELSATRRAPDAGRLVRREHRDPRRLGEQALIAGVHAGAADQGNLHEIAGPRSAKRHMGARAERQVAEHHSCELTGMKANVSLIALGNS